MPVNVNGDTAFMHLHSSVIFARFPIPEPKLALSVTRAQKLAIWGEFEPTGISRREVSTEALLSVHLEVALAIVNNNLVVHGLTRKILHIWVHRGCWHRMHVRLAYVLCYDRNTEFPHIHLFVISC